MPFPADGLMVIVALSGRQPLEAFGDGFQPGGLRGEIAPWRVRAAHDHCQAVDRLVFDGVLLDDRVERAFLAVMAELGARRVVRNGTGLASDALDLIDRSEQKLSLSIDERANEPGA